MIFENFILILIDRLCFESVLWWYKRNLYRIITYIVTYTNEKCLRIFNLLKLSLIFRAERCNENESILHQYFNVVIHCFWATGLVWPWMHILTYEKYVLLFSSLVFVVIYCNMLRLQKHPQIVSSTTHLLLMFWAGVNS